ncbi:hypothetical protein, partial [Bilophila wadsworthia]|uniref:hypothetical protein n=1 Tax=Bilophila wadsworthia TaxID=35833 RepID=UPI00266C0991
ALQAQMKNHRLGRWVPFLLCVRYARRGAWRLERQAVHRRRRVGEWRTVRAVGPAWNGAGISERDRSST